MNFILSIIISLLVILFAIVYRRINRNDNTKKNNNNNNNKSNDNDSKVIKEDQPKEEENGNKEDGELKEEKVEGKKEEKLEEESNEKEKEKEEDEDARELKKGELGEESIDELSTDSDERFLRENGEKYRGEKMEMNELLNRKSEMQSETEKSFVIDESENTKNKKQELMERRTKEILEITETDDLEKLKEVYIDLIDVDYKKYKFTNKTPQETEKNNNISLQEDSEATFIFDDLFSVISAYGSLRLLEFLFSLPSKNKSSKYCLLNAAIRKDVSICQYLFDKNPTWDAYIRFYFNHKKKNIPLLIKEIVPLESELSKIFSVPQILEGPPNFKMNSFSVTVKEINFSSPIKGNLKFGFYYKGNSHPLVVRWDESPHSIKTKVQKKNKKIEEQTLSVVPPKNITHVEQKYSSLFDYFSAKFAILVYQYRMLKDNSLISTIYLEIDDVNRYIKSGETVNLEFLSTSSKEKGLKGNVKLSFSMN